MVENEQGGVLEGETVEELTRGRVIIERDKDTQVREGNEKSKADRKVV